MHVPERHVYGIRQECSARHPQRIRFPRLLSGLLLHWSTPVLTRGAIGVRIRSPCPLHRVSTPCCHCLLLTIKGLPRTLLAPRWPHRTQGCTAQLVRDLPLFAIMFASYEVLHDTYAANFLAQRGKVMRHPARTRVPPLCECRRVCTPYVTTGRRCDGCIGRACLGMPAPLQPRAHSRHPLALARCAHSPRDCRERTQTAPASPRT
jgi:hypothetical protein